MTLQHLVSNGSALGALDHLAWSVRLVRIGKLILCQLVFLALDVDNPLAQGLDVHLATTACERAHFWRCIYRIHDLCNLQA